MTLKIRLILLYLLLLFTSVILVGACSYWNIWHLFLKDKSDHIRARAKPIIDHWVASRNLSKSGPYSIMMDRKAADILAKDLTSRDASAMVIDASGSILAQGRRLPEEPKFCGPDPEFINMALGGENEVTYICKQNSSESINLLIPLRSKPGSHEIFGVVQITAPLTELNALLLRHGVTLASVTFFVLVIGIAAGTYFITSSLKNLHILAEACTRVSQGDFSKKIEIGGSSRDELTKVAAAFNRMVDKLQKMFASQKRFVANAAHELLTPLTGIKGSVEVLLRGAQDDPQTMTTLLKGIHGEINRLITLCEQLLGMSRIQNASSIIKKPLNLADFFENFERKAKLIAPRHKIILDRGRDAKIFADPNTLIQILLNIVSNAAKYSDPDSTITISWSILRDHIEIRIADEGEGIDPKLQERIFEPFFMAYSKTGAIKGAGLGLALTKAMVEAHGGKIWVNSTPGRGTTFYFTIPTA